jgi:hypothetical protein
MTLNAPAHMTVVKKEEKETKLREFLAQALKNVGSDAGMPVLRVMARCSGSPVVRAVAAVQGELAAAGVEALVMLALVEGGSIAAAGSTCSVRHLGDVRCLDAHELLVIGTAASWIGDSMRRDPSVRDSFELHALGDEVHARQVVMSFDRLWARAAALNSPVAETVMEMTAELAGLSVDAASAPQVLTRH